MEVRFIGQGYNREVGSSVAEELIRLLNDERFNSFKCLVAFASPTGVSGLTDHIIDSKDHIDTFRVVIGIDQFGTSKEALEALLQWEVDSFVFYTTQRIIFHPKIYVFEGEEAVSIIIGSNNLTQTGLAQNIEGAVLISYNKSEESTDLLNQIISYYDPLLIDESPYLRPLTEELIEQLVLNGKIKNESQRRSQYTKQVVEERSVQESEIEYTPIGTLFPTLPIQGLPSGFSPTRMTLPSTDAATTSEGVSESHSGQNEENGSSGQPVLPSSTGAWTIELSNEVLIAEIGGPSRWRQVNFPIRMFENFFGATAGDNSYRIRIRHIEDNGTLNNIEDRQAVTVSSQNYRFEIGAASGFSYTTAPNRPIVVFIKINRIDFLYKLLMPTSTDYTAVRSFLYTTYTGPNRNLRRILTTVGSFQTSCPTLSFLNT